MKDYQLKSRILLPLFFVLASQFPQVAHAFDLFGPKLVHGVVFDAKTGAPMQGAFVLGVYTESGGTLFGHNSTWCVRTEGRWTDEQGRFVLKKGKDTDPQLYIIKEGYIENPFIRSPKRSEIRPNPNIVRKFYLEPVAVSRFEESVWVACERPTIRDDVEANITYLELFAKEDSQRRHGEGWGDSIRSAIARFKSLPQQTKK